MANDFVGNVVPDIGRPDYIPFADTTDHPSQVRVGGSTRTTDQAVFHLGEVALEEVDLMLEGRVWGIGVRSLHAEVVENFARVDSSFGLGDELGSAHVLAIPVGGRVNAHFGTLL